MSDIEVLDMEQETDEFNIPKEFNINELDDNIEGFLSSSSEHDELDDLEDEEDYLAQIENNKKVQEWCDKNKNGKPNKRKHEELNDNTEDTKDKNKYAEAMEMEQSTSGLNIDDIRESVLFREFRVIGLVCNDVPFCYQKLGDSFFIGTSIGKSFQVYEGKTLRLKISGRSTTNNINAMIMRHELTFTAVQSNIEIWYRVKKVGVITKHRGKVYLMKLMGHLLLTIGEDRKMYIWDLKRLLNRKFDISLILSKPSGHLLIKKPLQTIDFSEDKEDRIECICHPPTYLNKILIGYRSGKMELWNINSTTLIYTFKNHLAFDISAKGKQKQRDGAIGITCIEASPILDVVAIGFSNGYIVIHNVKTDEMVMRFEHFNHSMNGRINGLSFRNDGIPYLVSVGSDCNIVIWDLKQRKLSNIYYKAHQDRIITAKFIENENILVTSSADNSLKMWIFDDDDDDYGNRSGKLRLLKQRSGHSSAPHLCAFHGRKTLLSTANDHTLRVSWIQRDIQCLSMGQRAANKHSIPRIKCIDSKMSKSRFWSNVVTVHNNDNTVRLWNTSKFKLIESSLQPLHDNKRSKANASCAIISHCGHFVYVGRTSGVIDKYNIESALHRLQIPFAHGNIVRSLHLSMFNNVLISLGGDGLIKFWNIKNGKCQHVIEEIANHNEVISRSCYDKRSNLLAVATDNLLVYLFDGSNGSLIRKLNLNREGRAKYYSHVTSMIFSPRCQWLLIATMDGSVRVYDLATGLIIDWFKFKNAVTSMSFAVNNTFLATTHCNTMGIHIWANKHHFTQPFLTKVGNKPLEMDKTQEKEMDEMDRAVAQAMKDALRFDEEDSEESDDSSLLDTDLDDVLEQEQVQHEEDDEMELPDIAALHLTPESALITMSSNPKSIWKNMGNWDLILQRNRPSMKVKKNVENIPFFIPTKLHHRYLEMDTAEVPKELQQNQMEMDSQRKLDEVKQRKKILAHVQQKYEIDLIKYNTCSTLIYFIKKGLNSSALKYLLSLNPSASDAEIHCIGINIGTAKTELMLAINFFIAQLETNRNFEHIQSFISLFLKVHCDLIIKHSKSLHFVIQKLKQLMQQKWHKINDLFQSNLCLVQFYSHIQQ
eukprot:289495_1